MQKKTTELRTDARYYEFVYFREKIRHFINHNKSLYEVFRIHSGAKFLKIEEQSARPSEQEHVY